MNLKSPFCLLFVTTFRSSPLKAFLWETVLKICSKFTKEHPSKSLISIKLSSVYMEITIRHRCSPVNLLYISEHLFIRTPYFFSFVLLHSFYVSCELSYFSINWFVKAATGRSSTKKLYCIFAQKLVEKVEVLVAVCVVSLQAY